VKVSPQITEFEASREQRPPLTRLLEAWKEGDASALNQLIPLVYGELKRMASAHLSRFPAGQTMQPTALVHEAYLRLAGAREHDFHNSAHFRCVAARIMRQILADRARARHTQKRDCGWKREFNDTLDCAAPLDKSFEALDDALSGLERQDEEKARILELKYFGGLTAEEISGVLGLTLNRVNWQIRTAQAWLRREMEPQTSESATNLV
jgi:RNA polymerase sigma factor (TIGR02999 family)